MMSIEVNKLAKMTKAEILAEYKKLLGNLEGAQQLAAETHDPKNRELLAKSKEKTVEQVQQSVRALREMAVGSVDSVEQALVGEMQRLEELRAMVDLQGKELETQYNIKIAADTLASLVAEHTLKQQQFSRQSEQQRVELESELAAKRREWVREQEELEYGASRKRRHEDMEAVEASQKRQRELQEREDQLTEKEQQAAAWHKQVENFPDELESALQEREQAVIKRARAEAEVTQKIAKQEWEAEKQVLKLQLGNLEEQIKQYQKELQVLRQDTERANKRAQDLAVQIIKGGRHDTDAESTAEKSAPPPRVT